VAGESSIDAHESERRLDHIEQSLVRVDGKIDLLAQTISHNGEVISNRFVNVEASVHGNQVLYDKLKKDVDVLHEWRRSVKSFGAGAIVGAAAVGALGGGGIVFTILKLVKGI